MRSSLVGGESFHTLLLLPALWVMVVFLALVLQPSHAGQRFKRLEALPLAYPSGATLKLLFGYSTPITMPGRIMSYSQNFQFQFTLPQNATFFSEYYSTNPRPLVLLGRRRRRRRQANMIAERSILYQHLEEELQRRGGPGKDCLKRSICESAETPLKDDGLVGEILHVLLTPGDEDDDGVSSEFREAARLGSRSRSGKGGKEEGSRCYEAYPSCPKGFGILDHISELFDHD